MNNIKRNSIIGAVVGLAIVLIVSLRVLVPQMSYLLDGGKFQHDPNTGLPASAAPTLSHVLEETKGTQ